MTLYVDKYRPRDLDSIDYHKKQAAWLKRLAQGGDLPHLLIYGPPGSGKKTRVMATLKELYGGGVDRLRIEQQVFTTQSKKKIELRTLSSNYHIEVNPSDVGNQDRVVIQELLKGIAQTHNVAVQAQQDKEERKKTFKVVILTEVERLSKEAQHALRRTMEKYMASCRLILMCNSTTKVIPAIRSRCLGLRVPAPTAHEIVGILQGISKRENLSLPEELAKRIAAESYGNLRKAILMLEAIRVKQFPFAPNQDVILPDWEVYIRDTANEIIKEQSPQKLFAVRERIYELLSHLVPPQLLFEELVQRLLEKTDDSLKKRVISEAATYEHRMQLGSKPIFHIEAFIAKYMALYREYQEEAVAMFD
ncbi:replication factor C subunit 3-like isoform X1 [Varroa jacobsoni]|uniref:Replication factor C subunit 3 n=1 Tax=Varroa destructor TaxID=109461 RepID=A0A7M7K027_VARDE|nr:replication factor C subunit 3-like isoform X1 [Varroa destructor]XP_022689583.1 replication factor C subunit 3-like isoform X1 [Varroa jacobsoni]